MIIIKYIFSILVSLPILFIGIYLLQAFTAKTSGGRSSASGSAKGKKLKRKSGKVRPIEQMPSYSSGSKDTRKRKRGSKSASNRNRRRKS